MRRPSTSTIVRAARPPTLSDPPTLSERVAALSSPHVAELETFRAELEERHGPTPHFDPFDGGCKAKVLLLLETPGPSSAEIRFVSRDNSTGTAANLRRFCASARLDRHDTVIWNTVPWNVHAPQARNRSLRRGEVASGLRELPGLLDRLPHLLVIVLAGRVAGAARSLIAEVRSDLLTLSMPHPSPTYVNTAVPIAGTIVSVLEQAAVAARTDT